MKKELMIIFFIFILSILIISVLSFVSAWRAELFPENWQPVDEIGAVQGVNVFYDVNGTFEENGNKVTDGHPAYHPYKFLHDFSYAGYQRGEKPIPPLDNDDWTKTAKVYDVTKSPYNCIADGKMDCRAAIQKAIDDAGNNGGGIVYLPEGEYRIASLYSYFLKIRKSNVVLRGAGVGKTRMKVDPYSNGEFNMAYKNVILVDPGKNWLNENSSRVSVTKDLMFPTKIIPLSDVSLFRVGDPIVIKTNGRTASFLKEHDMETNWGSSEPGYVFRRTVVEIDPVGKTISIDVPTRYRIRKTDSPIVVRAYPSIKEIGFEDFSIGQVRHPKEWDWSGDIFTARDTRNPPIIYEMWQTRLFKFSNVENGWMYNIKSYMPAENAGKYTSNTKFGKYEVEVLNEVVLLSFSRFITLKDLYFKNAQVDAGSANGYATRVEGSELLLENVAIERFKKGFAIENQWTSGNVIKDSFTNMALDVSDLFHWELSIANLVENHVLNGSYWKAIIMSSETQGHSSSESVFWNLKGLKEIDVDIDSRYDRDNDNDGIADPLEGHGDIEDIALVISNQYGNGYVIGTSGEFSSVLTPVMQRNINGNYFRPYTLPRDYQIGIGDGDSLEPRSLYEAQLALRLGKEIPPVIPPECIDLDNDGFNQSAASCGKIDCNDNNAAINPSASEICGNEIDEDCSGADLICPASGGYEIPGIGSYYLEAERYTVIYGTAVVVDDADASQMKSVLAPNGKGLNAWTEFSFNLQNDASFIVWVRARGITGDTSSDSVYVSVDNGIEYAIHTDRDYFSWKKYSSFPLTAGKHVLKIRAREDGVRWDKILLTTDSSVVPLGLGGEALIPSGSTTNESPRSENSWLEFQGKGYVEIPDSDALSVGKTNSLSFSLFVKNNNDLSRKYILGKSGEYGIRTNPTVKNVDFYTWDASGGTQQKISTNLGSFQNSKWTHLGFSHEEGVVSFSFTNGIFQGKDTSTGAMLLNGKNPLTIGASSLTSTDNFDGSFTDLRIYSKPIYSGAMATIYEELTHENLTYIPIISLHQYAADYSGTDSLYVNEKKMRELLELLNSLGYSSITDVDYYEWTQGRGILPEKPVIITWDDGFDDMMDVAPLMAEYGYKGVAALITGWVGKSGRVTWDDVNTLVNVYNWTLASHTLNHCDLVRTCNTTQTREGNLSGSKEDIIKYTGKIPFTFVHPFNSWNADTMQACAKYYKMCIGPIGQHGMMQYITQKSNLINGDLSRIGVSVNSGNQYLQRSFNFSYNLESLIAHYTFDEGSGNILHDSSGNGYDGIIYNAFWRTG